MRITENILRNVIKDVIKEEFQGFNPRSVPWGKQLSAEQVKMRDDSNQYIEAADAGLRQVRAAIVKSQEAGCDISLRLAEELHFIYQSIDRIEGRPVRESGMLDGDASRKEIDELDTFIALLKNYFEK
tara:strand:+ start:4985 stop:5368 length:384 start_codon:yes stop_codon:yes gene_type:complete